MEIEENVKNLLKEITFNPYNEKVTLVGATKTRTVDEINQAIKSGLTDIGENKAQEFRDKYPQVLPCNYHFFGRLQTNKVKYLVGKACLIQSVDSYPLAQEISNRSTQLNVTTKILLELNVGETQKGGIPISNAKDCYEKIKKLPNIVIKGFMCVLPDSQDENLLKELCLQVRSFYDIIRKDDNNIDTLSMGMSQDYKIAIKYGSNMVRLGTAIFGKRDYNKEITK